MTLFLFASQELQAFLQLTAGTGEDDFPILSSTEQSRMLWPEKSSRFSYRARSTHSVDVLQAVLFAVVEPSDVAVVSSVDERHRLVTGTRPKQ